MMVVLVRKLVEGVRKGCTFLGREIVGYLWVLFGIGSI
jgi:hypothetical protein